METCQVLEKQKGVERRSMGDLEERLKVARQNVGALQEEFNRISTLLTKWQGVAEYLESLQAEEKKAEAAKEASKKGESVRP